MTWKSLLSNKNGIQMKFVIVGGVAADAAAATWVQRLVEHAEITAIERGPYVSYGSNAGHILQRRPMVFAIFSLISSGP